jgi:hypothetical protein
MSPTIHIITIKEVELILGLPSEQSDGVTGDRGQTSRDLLATWEKVKRKYVGAFYDGEDKSEGSTRTEVEAKRRDKASAWYAVAYSTSYLPIRSTQDGKEQEEEEKVDMDLNKGEKVREKRQTEKKRVKGCTHRDRQFLAFGWIMAAILEEIPQQVQGLSLRSKPSFLLFIGQQLVRHWHQHSESLAGVVKKKILSLKKLQDAVDPRSISLFGSVAQFLCDEDSDIDVYSASSREEVHQQLCVGSSTGPSACIDPTQGTPNCIKEGDWSVSTHGPAAGGENKLDHSRVTEKMSALGPDRENGKGERDRVDVGRDDRPTDIAAHSNERAVLESLYLNSVIAPLVENIAETMIEASPSTSVPVLR